MIWIAAGLTAETMIFAIAGFTWFFFRGYSFAEACAAGIVSMFMLLSLIHQISFVIGSFWLAPALEALMLVIVCCLGRHRIRQLKTMLGSVTVFFRHEKVAGMIFSTALVCMAVSVVFGWMSLPARIEPMDRLEALPGWQAGSLFELAGKGPVSPLNAQALFVHTNRFGLLASACGFGLLGVMAVGFSTYALARRYAWPPLALTTSLLALCIPRLIFLAGAPTGELIHTAAVCMLMVLIYRLVEQHQGRDLLFFILCACFSIVTSPFSLILIPVLLLLMVVVMLRRHGWLVVRELVPGFDPGALMLLFPALVLAQVPVFSLNWLHGETLFGFSVISQDEGIVGALDNVLRYFFSSVDPTEPLQKGVQWFAGIDLSGAIMKGYGLLASLMPVDAVKESEFRRVISGDEGAGFGPFALLLVASSMVHVLARGTRRLKATVVAWAGYLYVASLAVAWHPVNIEALTPIFSANCFIVAFSLPPWRLRKRGLLMLQLAIASVFFWSLWCFL